jgi:tRNA (guanine37-N1)-methyltransferase
MGGARIALVALLPELCLPVTRAGVVGKAFEDGMLGFRAFSPREFAPDRHRTVDDRPYGGGPGMVMKYEPVTAAIRAAVGWTGPQARRIALCATGRRFGQAEAAALAEGLVAGQGLVLLAGRYEGVDERVYEAERFERLSVGDFVLSGGELAAAVVIDAAVRLMPGVLGHDRSAAEDSFAAGLLDWPHYTRPEKADGRPVPPVLLGGDHAAIERWRRKQALGRTWRWRPDLLRGRVLAAADEALLDEYRREVEAARGTDEELQD